jgi:hypothetical protein
MGYYEITLRYDGGLTDRYLIFAESKADVKTRLHEALRDCSYAYEIMHIEKSNIDGIIA